MGVKHIPFFVEKPPGLNFSEIKKLCKKLKKYKLKNMVGYNRRYYSNFKKGLKLINDKGGLLGLIVEGHERFWKITDKISNVNRENWLYSNSSHTIDLLRFFGGEIKECSINPNFKEYRSNVYNNGSKQIIIKQEKN